VLVPHPSPFEVEFTIAKLKRYKLPGSYQILTELTEAGDEMLLSEICKLINSIWNKQKLPDQWKESIIVPVYMKGGKIDCCNYHGISLLSTLCKMLSSILSRLSPYINEIIGDHQCGFRCNTAITD
jgi:hypothetical protein